MQNFKKVDREELKKRDFTERVGDFNEIYEPFKKDLANEQARRCVQCGNPFCHSACPLHNYIPYWLFSTANKDLQKAFDISNQTNPFPEITGRICPQDRLCEGACTLSDGFGAIMIGAIETSITEEGFKAGFKPKFKDKKSGKKVAIIGGGPAGISAANYLLKDGIDVVIYDEASRVGGLLTYGIPSFKLEKSVVKRRVQILKDAGLEIVLNKKVGKDIKFEEIASKFDAVFIAVGARVNKSPNLTNENAKNCYSALDFLTQIQKENFKESDKFIDLKDKKVLVIGGGDTAMDCLRSSLRKGASDVICAYRRDRSSMPGSRKEFINAHEEGAKFIFNVAPKDIIINEKGECLGLNLVKTDIKNGKVEFVKGSEFKVDADVVIFALGFDVEKLTFLAENGIEVDKYGQILVDENFQTSLVGVFAGGDCVRGSDLVVRAASDGKNAALKIFEFLN